MDHPNADRKEFLKEAGTLYDQMLARTGPATGDTFDDMEVQAETVGRQRVLKLLRDRLKAEEKAQSEQVLCPKCGRPMRRPQAGQPRHLDTASGPVRYARRHAICDRCRESFSPSGPPTEDPATRSVQPPDAKGL